MPAAQRLDNKLRQRFDDRTKVLIAERTWEGCDGLRVTDEMRYAVAGNAAMMLLGTEGYFFDSVTSILLFPGIIERYHDGVLSTVVGEAWEGGSVVLTWPEVQYAAGEGDGRNVVIHEFAHHLDGLDGEMGGSVDFPNPVNQRRWEDVARDEFDRLVQEVERGKRTLLDPYGATNPAEFFAVASETFFEQPGAMRDRHHALFDLLVSYYALDPRLWQSGR